MTVLALTYKSGQIYDVPGGAQDISVALLADSEVGAIFRITKPDGNSIYKIVQLKSGSNTLRTTVAYNPRTATAIKQVEPPSRAEIAAADVGDIFVFATPELDVDAKEGYSIVVEINGKKYTQFFGLDKNSADTYKSNGTYYIKAWPHVSTTEPGAIFIWGNRKYVATQVAGQIIFDDYIEDVSWPLNTVWGPPPTLSDPLAVDWSKLPVWSADNPSAYPRISNTSNFPSTNFTIKNFNGYIGWNLTILIENLTGSLPPISTAEIIEGGLSFKVTRGAFVKIEFYFNSPVQIDQFFINISASTRVNSLYTSGPTKITSIRNPRNDKALFISNDFLGVTDRDEIIFPDGFLSGPIANPFPASKVATVGVSDRIRIEIDNRGLAFTDTTLTLINWITHHVSIRPKYRVDFDPLNQNYLGRSLDDSPDVILNDQNTVGGWIQEIDSAFDMDQRPDQNRDVTRGFYSGESFWGSINNTLWWCKDGERNHAEWVEQNVSSVSHPFESVRLKTFDTQGFGDIYKAASQGLFLDYDNPSEGGLFNRAFDFSLGNTDIGFLQDETLFIEGYANPRIKLFRNKTSGKNDILISHGSFEASLFTTFQNQGATYEEYQIPGGDISLVAGNAFFDSKGGDIRLISGGSIGKDNPGGNIELVLGNPISYTNYGFAIDPNNRATQAGDLGYLVLKSVDDNFIQQSIFFPNTYPTTIGSGLKVKYFDDEKNGLEVFHRRAYLEWDDSGKVIRKVSAPFARSVQPHWEIYIQETSRYIRKFTYVQHGGLYRPMPIPWCCYPEKEYIVYKPLIINRTETVPILDRLRPTWQFWMIESETEFRMFTWIRSGNAYRLLSIPLTSILEESKLKAEYILTKPATGSFGEITDKMSDQIERQTFLPTASTNRPAWDFYIRETSQSLYLYSWVKVGDNYCPLPIPWGVSINSLGKVVNEFALTKPGITFPRNRPTEELGEIVKRSSSPPELSRDRPHWEFYLLDGSSSLKWFTYAYVNSIYYPVEIPWLTTYNSNTNSLVYETEVLK